MIVKCAVCGKEFDVLWPDQYRFKRGDAAHRTWLCSWGHLRQYDKGMDKTMNVERPQPVYDGFVMSVIKSPETKARYEFAEGCLFVRIGADEVVLEPSAWRKLIDEIPRAAAVLGVEV